MRHPIKKDIVLNVFFPLLIGGMLYVSFFNFRITGIWRNHLADGLWSYSLTSIILIIWKRKINPYWILGVFLIFILFETMQYFHFIDGTGDFLDLITYLLCSTIALITNNFFSKPIKLRP
jgi:hypothetical protein